MESNQQKSIKSCEQIIKTGCNSENDINSICNMYAMVMPLFFTKEQSLILKQIEEYHLNIISLYKEKALDLKEKLENTSKNIENEDIISIFKMAFKSEKMIGEYFELLHYLFKEDNLNKNVFNDAINLYQEKIKEIENKELVPNGDGTELIFTTIN